MIKNILEITKPHEPYFRDVVEPHSPAGAAIAELLQARTMANALDWSGGIA
jgi:hypothetical protein